MPCNYRTQYKITIAQQIQYRSHTSDTRLYYTHIFENIVSEMKKQRKKNDNTMRLKNIVFALKDSGKQLKFEL